ncbi:MAG: PEP-CTERM sorting domain-containing protein [Methylophilaceae bacterium]
MALALQFSPAISQAAVFADDFNSYSPVDQLNWLLPVGWIYGNEGTVDLIGAGGNWEFAFASNGLFVDLDGSTNFAGLLKHSVDLDAGVTYSLTFDLAGSQRGDINDVVVNFGTSSGTYTLATSDLFSTKTLSFTPDATGAYDISFQNSGDPGDNVGALLDNVSVVAVPESETSAMMAVGLGVMGFVARRRRS